MRFRAQKIRLLLLLVSIIAFLTLFSSLWVFPGASLKNIFLLATLGTGILFGAYFAFSLYRKLYNRNLKLFYDTSLKSQELIYNFVLNNRNYLAHNNPNLLLMERDKKRRFWNLLWHIYNIHPTKDPVTLLKKLKDNEHALEILKHRMQVLKKRAKLSQKIISVPHSKKAVHPSSDRPERLLFAISFWIPRKYREAIVGDIMEDCHELSHLGKSERRIFVHVLWQLTVTVITLLPVSVFSGLIRKPKLKDETKE
jgi:hypothetical protein